MELSRREEVMPVCPATCTDGLVGLVAGRDRHVWDEAVLLPVGEVSSDNIDDRLLALQVIGRDRRKEGLLARLFE